jgi:hypothetical protein
VPSPHRAGRLIASALCVACVGWAVTLPLAPLAAAEPRVSTARVVIALPHAVGALVCHRRADRSFFTRGVQWPVCGRCTGLYLSAAIGTLATLLAPGAVLRRSARTGVWRAALVCAALPTIGSWLAERAGWVPTSLTRASLAAPLGIAVGILIAGVARDGRQNPVKT